MFKSLATPVIAYLSTGLIFVIMDAVWLGSMGGWYRRQLGELMAPGFHLGSAITFYLLYLVGLVFFAVGPALASGRLATACLYGAAFGFFTYVTYDLTNQATLTRWPLTLTLVDVAWGTVLGAGAATFGTALARLLLARIG